MDLPIDPGRPQPEKDTHASGALVVGFRQNPVNFLSNPAINPWLAVLDDCFHEILNQRLMEVRIWWVVFGPLCIVRYHLHVAFVQNWNMKRALGAKDAQSVQGLEGIDLGENHISDLP